MSSEPMGIDTTRQSGQTYAQYRFKVPEGATDVVLIRHGESAPMDAVDFPVTHEGQADPELSPYGREQAEALCARLLHVGIEAVYVSTLVRTQQTIAPLCAKTGLVPTIDADLREVRLGEWEGGEFRRRAIVRDPRMMELLAGGSWNLVPGAEDADGFGVRVRRALERIHAAHPNQRVAVVAHGGVIGQIIGMATGAGPLAFMACDNSSISQLVLHGEQWIVRRFNDTEHLGPALTQTSSPPE
ncbi:MAG: histidine phosphatase family protein [Sporichthyaceae bacterium]